MPIRVSTVYILGGSIIHSLSPNALTHSYVLHTHPAHSTICYWTKLHMHICKHTTTHTHKRHTHTHTHSCTHTHNTIHTHTTQNTHTNTTHLHFILHKQPSQCSTPPNIHHDVTCAAGERAASNTFGMIEDKVREWISGQ